jgi:predicted ester cyclase
VATEAGTGSSTEDVARAYFACVTARDPDGMMEFWKPGGIGTIHGITELEAPGSYHAWFAKLFAAIPDMRFEVIDVIAEDDRAAVRWRSAGTFDGTGDFEGVEPTGAKLELEGCDLLKIEDGKLVSLEAYMNGTEFARQVGLLPPLGSAVDKSMTRAFNLKTRAVAALQRRRQSQA